MPLYVPQGVPVVDDWKSSVKAASTANVTLPPGGTTLTLDTYACGNTDRVLLKDQTTVAQNGIYTVSGVGSSVVLTRATDADGVGEITGGTAVTVTRGDVNLDTVWTMASNTPSVIGTDPITFTRTYPPYSLDSWRAPSLPSATNLVTATGKLQNYHRGSIGVTAITPTTAVLTWIGAFVIPAGKTVSGVIVYAIAAGTLTARHVSLIRIPDRLILAASANVATSFTATALNSQAFASAYTPTVDTPCVIGLGVVFSVAPTFGGLTGLAPANFGGGGAGILTGNGQVVTTTPPVVGATATAPTTGNAGHIWASLY